MLPPPSFPLPFMPKYICTAQAVQRSVTCQQAHFREFWENFGGQQGRKSEIHIYILLNDIQLFLKELVERIC